MTLLNEPFVWEMFGILSGAIFILMLFNWSDRYDYVNPLGGRSRRSKEQDYALRWSFYDFYGAIIDPYTTSCGKQACKKTDFDHTLKINWDFCSAMPHCFFEQTMYEFSKLYKHNELDIHPFHATKETELYFYGHATKEEWYKRHPELIRYGLDKPYKPYKIDHPFNMPSQHSRKKIRGVCQAPLKNKIDRYGFTMRYEFETFPAEYTFEVIDNKETKRDVRIKWDDLVSLMDPEIVKECHRLVAPCPPKYFLEAYLSMAKEDIVLPENYFHPRVFHLTYPEAPHHLKVGIYYDDVGIHAQ